MILARSARNVRRSLDILAASGDNMDMKTSPSPKRHAFLVTRADRRAARRFHAWLEARGTDAAASAEALYLDAEALCTRFADGAAAVFAVVAGADRCSAKSEPECGCDAAAILVTVAGDSRCAEHVPELEYLDGYGWIPQHASPIVFASMKGATR